MLSAVFMEPLLFLAVLVSRIGLCRVLAGSRSGSSLRSRPLDRIFSVPSRFLPCSLDVALLRSLDFAEFPVYRFFFTRNFVCEGYVTQILHAELSSNVLMEPACHLAYYADSRISSFHTQTHWEDTDPCWGG